MTTSPRFRPSRRAFLAGAGTFAAWNAIPSVAAGAPVRDPRLIVVLMLGAMDGLALVAPVGDPQYANAREGLLLPDSGSEAALPLDSMFALNPHLASVHALYRKREALFVHAVASPYRSRSHFDGQEVLQSGYETPGHVRSGWLNRALVGLTAREVQTGGLAVAAQVPLLLRGAAPAKIWLPKGFRDTTPDTRERLMDLYGQTDPQLSARLAEALRLEEEIKSGKASMLNGREGDRATREFRGLARAAARIMNRDAGPRVGVLTLSGWDTHAAEKPVAGRFGRQVVRLDAILGTLADEMAEHWSATTVLVITEFGRMVRMNGTHGTDHGTATVAMLLGGAVNGGRVVSDWPGLAEKDLYEGRDLRPTTDLRAIVKGILAEQFSVPDRALAEKVFPGSGAVRPMAGLIRT